MEQVEASIARYLRALETADRAGERVAEAKSGRLKEKIAGLREQMRALKAMEQTVQAAPDQQVSLTDPDARSMATSGKGTGTRRLQCADRRRRRAPSDRGPRGDQPRIRPPPACAHGVQGTAGHGWRADHRPGRPRLLRRRPGPLVRRHGRRACRAQDPDLWQHQARRYSPGRTSSTTPRRITTPARPAST